MKREREHEGLNLSASSIPVNEIDDVFSDR
jgi:hypothetical protein